MPIVFLIVAGVLFVAYAFLRMHVMSYSPDTVRDANTIASVLIAEQEKPAPGEWYAIARVVLNRARMWGASVPDVVFHTGRAMSPWNDSTAFRERLAGASANKAFPAAYAVALSAITNTDDPTGGSMGFIHTMPYNVLTDSVPEWIHPVRLVIQTGNGKVAVFGGNG